MAVRNGTRRGVNSPQHKNTNANKGKTLVSARNRSRSWRSARDSFLASAAARIVSREAKSGWKERFGRPLAVW